MSITPIDDEKLDADLRNHIRSRTPVQMCAMAQHAGTELERALADKLGEYLDYAHSLEQDFAKAQRELYALRDTWHRRLRYRLSAMLGRIEMWWRKSIHKTGELDNGPKRYADTYTGRIDERDGPHSGYRDRDASGPGSDDGTGVAGRSDDGPRERRH